MLSDRQLEELLRRYRVVDPPVELALSIAQNATPVAAPTLAWVWGPAAAAVVLITWLVIQFSMLSDPIDPVRDAAVTFASDVLGGSEAAAEYASAVVPDGSNYDPAGLPTEEPWQAP